MSILRPEVAETLIRWREVIVAGGVVAMGLWVGNFGGPFYLGLGVLILLVGAALGVNGVRRMRFAGSGLAPGVVRMVEGQIAYFGPEDGGFVALDDLEELRLERRAAGRSWILLTREAAPLEIPVAAQGADILYDAFASLPGIDMGALVAALEDGGGGPRVVWRRHPRAALT